MTDIDVYAALRSKYEGTEEWIGVTEARAASWDGNNAQCDYIAINTFRSRNYAVHGHEIKISRNDWQRELKNPAKADEFMRYCDRWWLVVPSPWKTIVTAEGELPEGWGMMEVGATGKVRVIVQAPKLTRQPIPHIMYVGWMSRRDRQEKRSIATEIAKAETAGRETARHEYERNAGSRLETLQKGLDEAKALSAATGIKLGLNYDLDWRISQLRFLWELCERHDGLAGLASSLDQTGNLGLAVTRRAHATRDKINKYLETTT